jgi:uncharacterized membrane protein
VDTRRAESFSDGVFAVAITVLVFNLLPIARAGVTGSDLWQQAWPQYAGYVVSFLTIGIMWLNHHTVLSHVSKVDRMTLVLNLALLMTVVAVPFPTALVANNLGTGVNDPGAKLATVIYGLVMIVMSIAFSGLWAYLSSHAERLGGRSGVASVRVWARFSAGGVGYVVGVLVAALWRPALALALYGAVAVYYMFEQLPDPSSEGDSASDDRLVES